MDENNFYNSNAYRVQKQFTSPHMGKECPTTPQELSKDKVEFIIRMVMSEMHELACTVTANKHDSLVFMHKCLSKIDEHKHFEDEYVGVQKISAQFDALSDAMYYMYDTSARHGVNLDQIFNLVHDANRRKVDLEGGAIRRDDGKIQKPANWQPADIDSEIKRQKIDGAWSYKKT